MDRSVPAFNHDAPFKITDGKRLKIERAQRERSLDVQHCQIYLRLRTIVRVAKAERDYKVDTDRNISVNKAQTGRVRQPSVVSIIYRASGEIADYDDSL